MKAKYFTAGNFEAAAGLATDYFGCNQEEITFEQISDSADTEEIQLIAIYGTHREVVNMDASFGIYYESDGVYLEIYKERGAGYKLEINELTKYLERKKIISLNNEAVNNLVNSTFGRVKIAAAQEQHIIGEDLCVIIPDDELKASVVLQAPEPGGRPLSFDDARKIVAGAGVSHGIDEAALRQVIESKIYDTERIIAGATLPINGEDGKLVFHFSTDERTGSPKEIFGSGGRVNYRTLDLYVRVDKGELLLTREYATEGQPGITVRGKYITQKPGKEIMFPRGKNVDINVEKTEMYAQCSGMVEYVNNSVNVSNVYEVKGDCDLRIGDIDFDGSVHIRGNVCSGSTIRATGAVIVDGCVEAATIIAGGNVEVKGGMQGADKGMIEAGGAVSALYVERGKVQADGPVKMDMCIHSIIEAGDTFVVEGRRGAIIGGRVSSCGDITANYVGALSNARTEVAVGVTPRKRARLQLISSEINKLVMEQIKLNQLDAYLTNTKGVIDAQKWELLYRSSIENRRLNNDNLEALNAEKEILEQELANATQSMVHVYNTVFSGARVLIGQNSYIVKDEISYVSFKHSDDEVVFVPCELTKYG